MSFHKSKKVKVDKVIYTLFMPDCLGQAVAFVAEYPAVLLIAIKHY
tara:strand:- start:1995 stop:2132 length:138 start_codon:yes stop_codon:yes gene_type:complete